VLLERRKENKLAHYEKGAYQLTARYADQVELKSLQGPEYKRNVQLAKRFEIPDEKPQGILELLQYPVSTH